MKTAVVLFNLGGPDSPRAVQPFLYNLFSDKAIIRLPQPLRWFIARLISRKRAPTAQEIYAQMGGASPILPNTKAQAQALEAALGEGHKCFVAMRYWHPFSNEAAQAVAAYQPDRVILLPLYPQFSSTTTASSMKEFLKFFKKLSPIRSTTLCCYPTQPGFIAALADLISPRLLEAARFGPPRLLLSAHGLPEKVVKAGDPYQWQCEQTTAHLLNELEKRGHRQIDAVNCYQSRVGPLKWIGPSTDEEIERAGRERVPTLVVPLAFVSEHSETLVELDIEYRHLAEGCGVPYYIRVPTVSTHPAFIHGLAQLVRKASERPADTLQPEGGQRLCPPQYKDCPCRA